MHRMTADDGMALSPALAARIEPLLRARLDGLGPQAPAELSFANLWLFRAAHRWRFHDGDWPCVAGIGYDGVPLALPLFDPRAAPPDALAALIDRHGGLGPLAARETEGLDPDRFALAANPDDADYVYPAAQFRDYPGRLLQKKRNLMAQLLAAHTVQAEPYRPALHDEAIAVLDTWLADKGKAAGEADDPPCREALAHADALGLTGCFFRADGAGAGFLLAQPLVPGVWVVRFAKGLARYKGIAQYMFHRFASRDDLGAQWLNFEQDLGLPNFRQTKQSYQPAFRVAKWRVVRSR